MFPASSPTFGKLKCPSIDSNRPCPFAPTDSKSKNSHSRNESHNCIFSHDPEVYRKGDSDGRIGLSSLAYYKDLQKRIRSEQSACKATNLFDSTNTSSDAIIKATEGSLVNFLHRAPAGFKISVELREKVLLKLVKALRAADATCTLARAAEIEYELLVKGSTRITSIYLSAVATRIKALEKLTNDTSECSNTSINSNTINTSINSSHENNQLYDSATYEDLLALAASKSSLDMYSYPLISDEANKSILVHCSTDRKSCRRCGMKFVPSAYYAESSEVARQPCRFHGGRVEKIGGLRVYGCCQAAVGDANGCETHEYHVFEGFNPRDDPTPRFPRLPSSLLSGSKAVALDAEMCYTSGGYEVSRLTMVDFFSEATLLDVLVLPRCPPVIDYNTKWSGVDAKSFVEGKLAVRGFDEAIREVAQFIGPETIIIGHSLDNDLKVLEVNNHNKHNR